MAGTVEIVSNLVVGAICGHIMTPNGAYNQFLTISLVQGATQYTHYWDLWLEL